MLFFHIHVCPYIPSPVGALSTLGTAIYVYTVYNGKSYLHCLQCAAQYLQEGTRDESLIREFKIYDATAAKTSQIVHI